MGLALGRDLPTGNQELIATLDKHLQQVDKWQRPQQEGEAAETAAVLGSTVLWAEGGPQHHS